MNIIIQRQGELRVKEGKGVRSNLERDRERKRVAVVALQYKRNKRYLKRKTPEMKIPRNQIL